MRGAMPLRKEEASPALPETEPEPPPRRPAMKQAARPGPAHDPGKPLEPGSAMGLDRRTHQRLRKGKMAIDGRLDLHGLTQDAAYNALVSFVENGWQRGKRCLLVITGKGLSAGGQGVLRQQVPRWLNETRLRPAILAVSPAQAEHGGSGALYVLLKRKRISSREDGAGKE